MNAGEGRADGPLGDLAKQMNAIVDRWSGLLGDSLESVGRAGTRLDEMAKESLAAAGESEEGSGGWHNLMGRAAAFTEAMDVLREELASVNAQLRSMGNTRE